MPDDDVRPCGRLFGISHLCWIVVLTSIQHLVPRMVRSSVAGKYLYRLADKEQTKHLASVSPFGCDGAVDCPCSCAGSVGC